MILAKLSSLFILLLNLTQSLDPNYDKNNPNQNIDLLADDIIYAGPMIHKNLLGKTFT